MAKKVNIILTEAMVNRENTSLVQVIDVPKCFDSIDENGILALQSLYQLCVDSLTREDINREHDRNSNRLERLGEMAIAIHNAEDGGTVKNVYESGAGYYYDDNGDDLYIDDIEEQEQYLTTRNTHLIESRQIIENRIASCEYDRFPTFILLHILSTGYVKNRKLVKNNLSRMQGLFNTLQKYHSEVVKDNQELKKYREDATKSINTLLTIPDVITYVNTDGERVTFPEVDYKSIPAYLWESIRSAPVDTYKWAMQDDRPQVGTFTKKAGVLKESRKTEQVIKGIMLPILQWQGVTCEQVRYKKTESNVMDNAI